VFNLLPKKKEKMKPAGISLIAVVLVGFASGPAVAEQEIVETISRDCQGEIARFCGDVSPGQGRLLDRLNKKGENISPGCKEALKAGGLSKF
jgi:hypothetical protein